MHTVAQHIFLPCYITLKNYETNIF